MTDVPSREYSWFVVLIGGIAVLGAAWFMQPTWPTAAITLPLLLIAVLALALAYQVQRQQARVIRDQQAKLAQATDLRLQVIEALALAIDARHRSTQSVRREQAYATALGRSFGMSADEVEGVHTAALLHDIGKLAVPDHILTKPGPLTPEELLKIRVHPQVGSDIISGVSFPYPVASLVRCHHERWDGTGYPAGLGGSEIPLGARILACADHFEALTSDRPFHAALTERDAIDVLWAEAGKALDPVVVARFVELLPSSQASTDRQTDAAAQALGVIASEIQLPGRFGGTAVMRDIAQAHREIYSLYDMSRAVGTTLGVADSMTVIAAKLHNLVPFDACALFLNDPTNMVVRCGFATGMSSEHLRRLVVPTGQGVVGAVVATRQCTLNGDPRIDVMVAGLNVDTIGLSSSLASALVVGDAAIGALVLYHADTGVFTEDHRRLLTLVSEQAAAVIANSVVFEQTQIDSVTDALTGLPNIRLLFVHLNRELARATRMETPLSLLLLDLDNLKTINDTFGHSAGDHALCRVAAVLGSAIRPYDLCVRYGGDEFIVVLSGCGPDEAEAKRLELQQAVDGVVFEVQGRKRVRLAISGGAAVFPEDGRTYEMLLAAADRRMYQDKHARKRLHVPDASADYRPQVVSDVDIDRAAAGVL
jgi:diguanylate cyclase (GGDEF)-like protein